MSPNNTQQDVQTDPTCCRKRGLNQSNLSNYIQQGVQTDPTCWMTRLNQTWSKSPNSTKQGVKQVKHVGQEDWINQTHPTISNRVFKRIQHFGWCLKRGLNYSNLPNSIQQGVQMDPTFWMFEEKIESIKLIQQYPTGFSNGSNILDDVWRGDWTNQTYPTISNRVFKWIQHFGCLKRRLNQSNSSNNIQQGVQTDPTFWMMFEENIEQIRLIQQYPTGCSNGSSILDDVWREYWTNQTHPTISNRVFKRIQHFGWCLKRGLN